MLVDLDLREVGIDGEIGREVWRDGVLDVAADFAAEDVVGWWCAHAVGRDARDRVRLELDVQAGVGEVETHQRTASRHTVERLRAGKDARHWREVVPFVLVADRAADLDAPHLARPRTIPERLEGNFHLDGPSAIEASRL